MEHPFVWCSLSIPQRTIDEFRQAKNSVGISSPLFISAQGWADWPGEWNGGL